MFHCLRVAHSAQVNLDGVGVEDTLIHEGGEKGFSKQKKENYKWHTRCIIVSLFIFPSENVRKQVFFSTFNLL